MTASTDVMTALSVWQIAIEPRLKLAHATLHLGRCEILVAAVHRLELAAIDGDDGIAEQPDLPTQHHELAAYPADCLAIVAADGLASVASQRSF